MMLVDNKYCPMCKKVKPQDQFNRDRCNLTSGLQSRCKTCISEYKKGRYYADPSIKEQSRISYYKYASKAKLNYQDKIKDPKEKERRAAYQRANPDKMKKAAEKHRATEKHKVNRKAYRAKLKSINHQQVIADKIRDRIRKALRKFKGDKQSLSSIELVGCNTWGEFRAYLESKFKDGMSWDRISEIHIDHIQPCASFDLNNKNELKNCFHYSNMQPLWKIENLKKGAKYNGVEYNNRNKKLSQ